MENKTIETLLAVLVPVIEKEKARHPMGMSDTLSVASKIGKALKEIMPELDLEDWNAAIGNTRY